MLTKEGDRLGIMLASVPGAVAYKIRSGKSVLKRQVKDTSLSIGTAYEFDDKLSFPYMFSVAAYVDSGKI